MKVRTLCESKSCPLHTVKYTTIKYFNTTGNNYILNLRKLNHMLRCFLFLVIAVPSFAQDKTMERYPSGVIRAEGVQVNGVKSGEWRYYFPSGKVMAKENFESGVLQGVVEYFLTMVNNRERSIGNLEHFMIPRGTIIGMERWKERDGLTTTATPVNGDSFTTMACLKELFTTVVAIRTVK